MTSKPSEKYLSIVSIIMMSTVSTVFCILAFFIFIFFIVGTVIAIDRSRILIGIYISPHGSDTFGSGTYDNPFRTITHTRDFVRQYLQSVRINGSFIKHFQTPGSDLYIYIRHGVYEFNETVVFTSEDSGDVNVTGNVIWSNYYNEKVFIQGSVNIHPSRFNKLTNVNMLSKLPQSIHDDMYEVDLSYLHKTIPSIGFNYGFNSWELFSNLHGRMTLARYPNNDITTFKSHGHYQYFVTDNTENLDTYYYSSDIWNVINTWNINTLQGMENDLRVHGYLSQHDWSDDHCIVSSITPTHFIIDYSSSPTRYDSRRPHSRFYFYNIFDAISQVNEYYINRDTNYLYIYIDHESFNHDLFYITQVDYTFDLSNVNYIHFNGLNFRHAIKYPIKINNCNDIHITNSIIEDSSHSGIDVRNTINLKVEGCVFKNNNENGIYLNVGERVTLTPANAIIQNNIFNLNSRRRRTYTPGVNARGVGILIKNNKFYNSPHEAIGFIGNDIDIIDNYFNYITFETGDCGAIYTGRDWTVNSLISGNRFENIHSNLEDDWTNAIYIDDMASNMIIKNNIVIDAVKGILIGGGRWNIVEDNIMIQTKIGINFDWRGEGWANAACVDSAGVLQVNLQNMNYDSPPFSVEFPHLLNILSDEPCTPKYNEFRRNIACNTTNLFNVVESSITSRSSIVENNEEYHMYEECLKYL